MTFTPKTKNDRGALAKEHTTASTQNHQKEASIMPKSTFQPGELVRNTKTGELYRIATTDKKPGYVGYVRVTPKVEYIRPCFLEPLYSYQRDAQPETKHSELTAELVRRGASSKTTITELGIWCAELGVDPLAIFDAYASLGFMANGASNE